MAEGCYLDCPELFEDQDSKYGLLGPFSDSWFDSPDGYTDEEIQERDPGLFSAYQKYATEREAVAKNCDENCTRCHGPQEVYDIKTRKRFMVCSITQNPYHLPVEG